MVACINAIFDAPYKVDIDEIWYNVYMNGEWQEEHDHIGGPWGSHYSCIHFYLLIERFMNNLSSKIHGTNFVI